ncbi:MAG: hypothetical protein U1F76_15935 [Candidatus Competibacteraceae bacterium]
MIGSQLLLWLHCSILELNPVRAGMVPDSAAYPWSSFTANAGAQTDPVITPHPLYLALGPTPATRASAYQALFTEVLDPAWVDSLRACTNGGFVLGSDRFQRQVSTAHELIAASREYDRHLQ